MSTYATTRSQSTLTITESGLPALRLAVVSDATEEATVVVEATLPSDVDPERVAVEAESGEFTVYADGTVQWTTTASAGTTSTAKVGIPITEPSVVDDLDDVEPAVVAPDDATAPTRTDDPNEGVDAGDLSSATPPERIPESVYERIHSNATDDTASEQSNEASVARSEGATTEDAETATDEPNDETVERAPDETAGADDDAVDGDDDQWPEDVGVEQLWDADVVAVGSTERDGSDASSSTDAQGSPRPSVERTASEPSDPDGSGSEGGGLAAAAESDGWSGDPVENALRVTEDRERADETAFRLRLSFDADDARTCAIEVLRGLLNGTTVYGANPTLPDLQSGQDLDDLTVTITSALDEDALVGAIEDLDAVVLESFERVEVDGVPSEAIESNAAEQFERLDDTVDATDFEEFAADLEAIETGGVDFGDEPVSFDDLVDDPTAASRRAAEQPSRSGGASAAADGDASERVAARLLEELQAGGITERERVELRRRLGVDPRTSTEARLDHLHARFEEIAAYTDALEEFLDENGTAREILDDVVDRTDALDDRADELEDRTGAVEGRTDELEDRTGALDERTDAIEDRTGDLEAAVEDAETARADVEARVDIVEADLETDRERIDDLESDLDRERERVDDVESDLADERQRLDEMSSAVQSNRDDLDHLADDVRSEVRELTAAIEDLDDALASIDDRLERLERDVERNSEVREKLQTLSS